MGGGVERGKIHCKTSRGCSVNGNNYGISFYVHGKEK